MHYHYQAGAQSEGGHGKKWFILAFGGLLLLVVLYMALLFIAPRLISMPLTDKSSPDATTRKIEQGKAHGTALYIPQFNIEVPVTIGGSSTALQSGGWQKNADASVTDGDTLSICARRFKLGLTPFQTKHDSPFFNLSRVAVDDQVIVDYKDNRFEYKVTDVSTGMPDTGDDKTGLIVFSCNDTGRPDGTTVLYATLVTKPSGKQTTQVLW